jgi:hypothetical protein
MVCISVISVTIAGAAYHGHAEMVALLLIGGANPEIKNYSGLDRLTPREEASGAVCQFVVAC